MKKLLNILMLTGLVLSSNQHVFGGPTIDKTTAKKMLQKYEKMNNELKALETTKEMSTAEREARFKGNNVQAFLIRHKQAIIVGTAVAATATACYLMNKTELGTTVKEKACNWFKEKAAALKNLISKKDVAPKVSDNFTQKSRNYDEFILQNHKTVSDQTNPCIDNDAQFTDLNPWQTLPATTSAPAPVNSMGKIAAATLNYAKKTLQAGLHPFLHPIDTLRVTVPAGIHPYLHPIETFRAGAKKITEVVNPGYARNFAAGN